MFPFFSLSPLRGLLRAFVCASLLLSVLATGKAWAQGFSAQPMFIEADVPAGRQALVPVEIFNTSGVDGQVFRIFVVELGQAPNGSWMVLPDGMPGGQWSASSWITPSIETIILNAGEKAVVDLRINIPRTAAASYYAGVLIRSDEIGGADVPMRLQIQFLIPVILSIEGRPIRQQVAISDVDIRLGSTSERARTSFGVVEVANAGRTFSRLRGTVQIDRMSGGTWRRVTRYEVPIRGILPGGQLVLEGDIERSLPSGRYRVQANLFIDGRRIAPMTREIDFQGDPAIDLVAYDTELLLDPPQLDLLAVPGATRTNIVGITNQSDRSVEVAMSSRIPPAMAGMAMGSIVGDDLSAAVWTEIRPETFTLGPYQRRNVRILSRMPAQGMDHANYYADLVLDGRYDDGQSAGETRTALRVRQQAVELQPRIAFQRMGFVEGDEPSQVALLARIANIGNVDIDPDPSAMLVDRDGRVIATPEFDVERGRLLPLGLRDMAGTMDLTGLPEGEYLLIVQLISDGAMIGESRTGLFVESDTPDDPLSPRRLVLAER